jgi:hypothetical protein
VDAGQKAAAIKRLNELGYNQVKHLLSAGGFPPDWNLTITHWLAEQEAEAERLNSVADERAASAAERAAAAKRASAAAERRARAAERANTRATIALVIATISIAATIIGMVISHFDAMRSAVYP